MAREENLVELEAKVFRQAAEIQRMARKIKNQRGMARTTWKIVEDRAHWTRGILNRNTYLDMTMAERKRRVAAEARVAQLETALKPFAVEADEWNPSFRNDYVPVLTPSVTEDGDNEKAAFTVGDLRRARTALSQSPDRESGV